MTQPQNRPAASFQGTRTRYRDPLPLAQELRERVGNRAFAVAQSRAFECLSTADTSGALLWEDVGRLLMRDRAPAAHFPRRLRFGVAA